MKQISIDTTAYSAFKRKNNSILEIIQRADLIVVSTIVLGELLGGFAVGNKEIENRNELNEFLSSPRVEICPIDAPTANFYAKVYTNLRTKGKPIPTNDLWIAASALQHGYTLCTLDTHFKHIDNLAVCTCLEELLP